MGAELERNKKVKKKDKENHEEAKELQNLYFPIKTSKIKKREISSTLFGIEEDQEN